MALTLPAIPMAYSPQMSVQPRVRSVSFGDGYSLRSPDGLNTIALKASVNWRARTQAEMAQLAGFFDAHGGASWFWWTPPGRGSASKFICPSYSWTPVRDAPGRYDIDAEFQQVHDLAG